MSTITITSKKKLVVMEEAEYRNLIERLEDLEDMLDAQEQISEYEQKGGISFDTVIESLECKK